MYDKLAIYLAGDRIHARALAALHGAPEAKYGDGRPNLLYQK